MFYINKKELHGISNAKTNRERMYLSNQTHLQIIRKYNQS